MYEHRSGNSAARQNRYATSIGDAWKEQTLLNIVKLRYADVPIFLEITQVIAGYQPQSTVAGSFTAGNFNAATIGPFTASGTATAGGTYTDRPTVIYSPLTGVDFLRRLMPTVIYSPLTGVDFLPRLMTPIPPSSVLFAAVGLLRRERHADHARGGQRGDVHPEHRLPVALSAQRPAAAQRRA
jgi:hypothetical protein